MKRRRRHLRVPRNRRETRLRPRLCLRPGPYPRPRPLPRLRPRPRPYRLGDVSLERRANDGEERGARGVVHPSSRLFCDERERARGVRRRGGDERGGEVHGGGRARDDGAFDRRPRGGDGGEIGDGARGDVRRDGGIGGASKRRRRRRRRARGGVVVPHRRQRERRRERVGERGGDESVRGGDESVRGGDSRRRFLVGSGRAEIESR